MSDYDYLEEERSNEQGTLEPNLETLEPSLKRLDAEGSNENVSGKPRGLMSKMPSRRELEALKQMLGITKGSLQYKAEVDKVYHVIYNPAKKGYDWKMERT